MASKKGRNYAKTEKMENLSVPPGFKSLTSFTLERVEKVEEADKSQQEPMCMESVYEMNDTAAYKSILWPRPWILFDQSNHDPEKSDTEHLPKDLPSNAFRPKGVILGCPDCSDCPKVTASWCPENARRDVLEEARIFLPTEEEFKDTLKYIASIHSKAEPYGICRIIPPPSWQPQCLLEENNIWESSKLTTQIQRIDGLQVQCQREIMANSSENTKTKNRIGPRVALDSQSGNGNLHDVNNCESKPNPTFTLSTFKKFADDFKALYFNCDNKMMSSDKMWEPTVENLEGEYGRIVQNPTEEIEVYYGKNLEAGDLSSGFPIVSDPLESFNYPEYMKSGWNLNNMLTQTGSLLSFESSEVSRKFAPKIHVGMCFSSFNWKVEDHQLYSLCYMHLGEPRVWYSIPGRFAANFKAVMKKYLPVFAEQPDLPENLGMQLSSTILKSEGIPVYRCVQHPREFVLVFSGAYHSGFDCGFNYSESVSFAPLEWLLHGQNVVELHCEQRRKTLISYDKLLLGAARKAVRAQFEIEFCRLSTPDNLTWKDACGRNGILTKALDSRLKSESLKREFLCTSLKSRRMEDGFDATCKRECIICLRDLHLSAAGCLCSKNKFACLNHAKQLCSCAWSNKFILCRYEINELNVLCLALEGKLSAIHRWSKEYLGISLHKRLKQTPGNSSVSSVSSVAKAAILNAMKRKRDAVESEAIGIGKISSGIEPKLKAPLLHSKLVGESKEKQKTVQQQSATTNIHRGINSVSGIKSDTKQKAVRQQSATTCIHRGTNSASGIKSDTKARAVRSEAIGAGGISSGIEPKLKAPLLQSKLVGESKEKQKTVRQQSATTNIHRGINSVSGIKSDTKQKAVRQQSATTCIHRGTNSASGIKSDTKARAVRSEATGAGGISSGIEPKLKAPLLQSKLVGELKEKQKTVRQQSATTCIHRGINSVSGIKSDTKARAVRSKIPNLVENDPKPKTYEVFSGASATLGYMAFLSENKSLDISSDSSSSSSESDDDT